jgi:hypothetical protein
MSVNMKNILGFGVLIIALLDSEKSAAQCPAVPANLTSQESIIFTIIKYPECCFSNWTDQCQTVYDRHKCLLQCWPDYSGDCFIGLADVIIYLNFYSSGQNCITGAFIDPTGFAGLINIFSLWGSSCPLND